MANINGNDKGELDGVYSVLKMMGGSDYGTVTVVLERNKKKLKLELRFEEVEFSRRVQIERNTLRFLAA